MEKRGCLVKQHYLTTRVELQFEMPLAEIVFDFYDRLKSISQDMFHLIILPVFTVNLISYAWILRSMEIIGRTFRIGASRKKPSY